MISIKLSTRLQAVADLIRKNSVAADIGTDHGKLVCYLAQDGLIKKGIACDVNVQPLEKAWKTIIEAGLQNKIEVFLTDGLKDLENEGITDIAIAGMGGELIANIIDASPWVKDSELNFVLQPMTRDNKLREYLLTNGFSILEEKAVSCGKFYYTTMRVQFTGICKQIIHHYSWSGELWDKTDNDSIDYLKSKLNKLVQMEPSFKGNQEYLDMLESWKERLK